MQFTWQEIIDRARVYVDDDHAETSGWIAPSKWMTILQVEYAQLYRRWIRNGLISPEPVDATLTNPGSNISGVLAILGVAELVDSTNGWYRMLKWGQGHARKPFRPSVAEPAAWWEAYGIGDTITVKLEPPATSGTYVVRYLTRPEYATDATATVELPYGADERLVLGLARRACLKESSASALLNSLISDADAEISFTAFARNGEGMRVKTRPRDSTPREYFPSDHRLWRWF